MTPARLEAGAREASTQLLYLVRPLSATPSSKLLCSDLQPPASSPQPSSQHTEHRQQDYKDNQNDAHEDEQKEQAQ
jgi:hypothetical protein